jgi:hypothetical protein
MLVVGDRRDLIDCMIRAIDTAFSFPKPNFKRAQNHVRFDVLQECCSGGVRFVGDGRVNAEAMQPGSENYRRAT